LVVLCCSLSANTGNLCFSRGGLFSNFAECIRRFELDDGERRIESIRISTPGFNKRIPSKEIIN